MKIADRLGKDTKRKLEELKDKPVKRKKKNKRRNVERFTERDLLDLMGIHRQTYERRNGAVRRK